MKTKYVKPMMMGVYETVAEGDACYPGSMANPASCVTGVKVDNPQPPTSCNPGATAAGQDCGTGNVVAACVTGGVPSSTCHTGIGVGH
jgi:hypothetical protein